MATYEAAVSDFKNFLELISSQKTLSRSSFLLGCPLITAFTYHEPTHCIAAIPSISQQARKDPKFQFTSLAHLLNEGFLKECYYRLGRDRASGIDGVSWKEYGENLDENIGDLVSRLKAKRYKPLPAKRAYIPKNEHEERPLGLPALEDKIVQKGISRILEAIYEADFLNCSYGFRPKRTCHQALFLVPHELLL